MTDTKKALTSLAKRIRKARTDAHLSQAELGTHIGVSDKSISSYEKGRSLPSVEALRKIAEKTNRSIGYFTEENTEETDIADKLAAIERDLQELKRLLNKK